LRARAERRVVLRDAAVPRARTGRFDARAARCRRLGRDAASFHAEPLLDAGSGPRRDLVVGKPDLSPGHSQAPWRSGRDAAVRPLVQFGADARGDGAGRAGLRSADVAGLRHDRGEPSDDVQPAAPGAADCRLGRAQRRCAGSHRRRRVDRHAGGHARRGRGRRPRRDPGLPRKRRSQRLVVPRRLVSDRRPRSAHRRIPVPAGTAEGDDHPRRREHLAGRDRRGAALPPRRRRSGVLRRRRREVRPGGRSGGGSFRERHRAGVARALPPLAGRIQGPRHDPGGRRDPPYPHRQGPAPDRRRRVRSQAVRFAVLGAGAIGGYVGAALARGGADVTLIAGGPHLRAIQDHGIRVLSERGDFSATPVATDSIEAAADADVVFLGLKANGLTEIAPRLGELLRPGAAIIAAQNGIPWWYFQNYDGPLAGLVLSSVDPGGVISATIGIESVIGCVIYCSTEIVAPGVIRHIEGTRFTIGEPDGVLSERCNDISQAFVPAGLKCPVERSLRDQIWLKLIGNAAFNPISALTGATLGQLGALPEMMTVLRAIMEECTDVATALGASL